MLWEATMMRVFLNGQHVRPVLCYRCSSRRHISAATTAENSTIKVQQHPAPHSGVIRVLLLDRPEARNALSRKLVSELTRHVDDIQAEAGAGKTRALIIASNIDPAFCSGADLKERKQFTEEE